MSNRGSSAIPAVLTDVAHNNQRGEGEWILMGIGFISLA